MWAVGLVVLFHLWPSGLVKGGFVGVDAFFVISGYLITSHLIREVEATGRVRLAAFYARRARRLLPASLVVLAVCVPASLWLLPSDLWEDTSKEVLASTFYVQNLWLASKAVTYSASNDVASPVQHYWSLSTEEQFYLVWPSLILLALLVNRVTRARRPVVLTGAVLAVVAVASFWFSVAFTRTDTAAAYFVTPTRAWEFAAGALLPLLLRRYAPPGPLSVLLRYLGLGILLVSALLLSQQTPFPGAVAVWPVLGTALVILAGDCEGRDRLDVLFTNRVAQWLGDISYSVYLWHWPLIVLVPYLTGGHLRIRHKLLILGATLVLSHLSKRYVEDATRFVPRVRRSTARSLLAALGVMIVVGGAAGGMLGWTKYSERRTQEAVEASLSKPCFGASARLGRTQCPDAFTKPASVTLGKDEAPWAPIKECQPDKARAAVVCRLGGDRPRKVVALVGDSHAQQYQAPLVDLARRKGWDLHFWFRGGCPAMYARSTSFDGRGRPADYCSSWSRRVTGELRKLSPDVIVATGYGARQGFADDAVAVRGFQDVWKEWTGFSEVVVVRDQPTTLLTWMPACLAQHPGDQNACARPRAKTLIDDPMTRAARQMVGRRFAFADLSKAFCDEQRCYPVVGSVPVYLDRDHVSRTFARTLTPYLAPYLP